MIRRAALLLLLVAPAAGAPTALSLRPVLVSTTQEAPSTACGLFDVDDWSQHDRDSYDAGSLVVTHHTIDGVKNSRMAQRTEVSAPCSTVAATLNDTSEYTAWLPHCVSAERYDEVDADHFSVKGSFRHVVINTVGYLKNSFEHLPAGTTLFRWSVDPAHVDAMIADNVTGCWRLVPSGEESCTASVQRQLRMKPDTSAVVREVAFAVAEHWDAAELVRGAQSRWGRIEREKAFAEAVANATQSNRSGSSTERQSGRDDAQFLLYPL